ncbi:MAG: site-2 protease family protein [bacterium]|nr:site-2 protease family protein [bacterium]MDZ4231230.1 site-2 protease family protein [Patescibacteria group bacterium]
MDSIAINIFQILILLFSVVIHEVSHGLMALKLGDDTAKNQGRLTLNPIPHLDPIGSILLPAILVLSGSGFVIGWAKPVPYNPLKLYKDLKYGPLKVGLIGPGSNLILALTVGLILRVGASFFSPVLTALLVQIVFINVLLAVFNLMPVPPLDGSKILTVILPPRYSVALQSIGMGGILLVFLFLMVFGSLIFSLTAGLTSLIIGPIPAF